MIPFDAQLIRLFLHVLAATMWVGGQFTLVTLLPTVRTLGDDAPTKVARAFARLAWPSFAVLIITGTWNLFEVNFTDRSTGYQVALLVKLAVVALSGVGAAVHTIGKSKVMLAVGGSLGGLGAIGALFMGVWLHG